MGETWIYVTWALVGLLLLLILIALIIVCVKNKRFSTMRSKLIAVLSMRNYEEDDFFQHEIEIHSRDVSTNIKDVKVNLEQYHSSAEEVFDRTEHIPIPRVNQIKFTGNFKPVFSEETFDNDISESVHVIPLSHRPKLSSGTEVISSPAARSNSNPNSKGTKPQQISKTPELFHQLENTTSRFNQDLFQEHSVFPRAKLVNFRGKSGSAQITSVSHSHSENSKPKKRVLPLIDPVENKPVIVKHSIRDQAMTESNQHNRENLLLGKSLTYSPGDKFHNDESDEDSKPRTQSLYDRRGRPLKKQTKKPSGVIVHEEVGPDFVILNKKRISKKDLKKASSKQTSKPNQLETVQVKLPTNDGIKRKNKPPPLNLALCNVPETEITNKTENPRQTNERKNNSDQHYEVPVDYDQAESDVEFSPEIQWKLKGDENLYELVYIN